MPADDLVLNVRQLAQYPATGSAASSSAALLMQFGIGGPYASISPQALVSTALSQGGDMAIAGGLSAAAFTGGSAQFSNASANVLWAQKATVVNFCAQFGTISGVPIATVDDVSALDAALRASTVWSFNGRTGDVRLWIDDILCAGGAPLTSPRFWGDPRAPTPPPTSNSSRLATTAFVATALDVAFEGFAPLESPNFSGVPTAPTAAVGSSDGQLATTAFVMNAVAESTTGVVSFNARTGVVTLTPADVTGIGGALLASPIFTGTPQGPTASPGTASTQLATCAFVSAAVAAVAGGVTSFNARTGDVVLTSADVAAVAVSTFNGRAGAILLLANDISAAGGALLAGPAFTGAPTALTAALGTNTTQLATCAFVQAAVEAVAAGVTSFNARTGAVTLTAGDLSAVGGALLAGPTFTGIPTAPTATPGTSSAQLATCAFVQAAVEAGTAGVASFNSRTGAVTLLVADISGAGGALLASPAFTGTPTGPTAAVNTNTAQLATCAFVQSALPIASTAAPLMDGTASAGSSAAWSRGDHVHPTDTSRASVAALAGYLPLSGGTITGTAGITLTGGGGLNVVTGAIASPSFSGSGAASVVSANTVFFGQPTHTDFFMQQNGGFNILQWSANWQFQWESATGITRWINNGAMAMQLGFGGDLTLTSPTANKAGGGAWGSTSDERIKTITGDYALGLNEIRALRPVDYVFKGNDTSEPDGVSPHRAMADGARPFVGLIAQEVEQIFPDMVTRTSGYIDGEPVDDLRILNTSELIFALVNAVKTLADRVDQLEAAR